MIDLQYIRDNAGLVSEKAKQKLADVDVERLLELDNDRRSRLFAIEELRKQRNELAIRFKNGQPEPAHIEQGRALKEQVATLEKELASIQDELAVLHKQIPNMPLDDVPIGASEDENVIAKEWGERPAFDFTPKSHWEIAEARDWIDKERAAKVAGARFAYIKGDLVTLQFAIIQWVMSSLGNAAIIEMLIKENDLHIAPKVFTPILPPAMIKTDIYDAMDRLEPRDDRYAVGEDIDDLWLQGSAEHTLGSMYKDEILAANQLPIRYIGFLTSFRREAGTYGKDSEGIIRMHQFDKLEMEVFSEPETGLEEHKLLVAIQEYLVQQLGLPYQLLLKCTADIGKPNARGVDINVWMPGQAKYRETHTADYMTDYQARRLKTRLRRMDGTMSLVHTNDATAFALGRIMVAIIENFQQKDNRVVVPAVLHPYMNGKTIL